MAYDLEQLRHRFAEVRENVALRLGTFLAGHVAGDSTDIHVPFQVRT